MQSLLIVNSVFEHVFVDVRVFQWNVRQTELGTSRANILLLLCIRDDVCLVRIGTLIQYVAQEIWVILVGIPPQRYCTD